MKLCKDCKHCAMPNPLANAYAGYPAYVMPMCGHPDAERSVVDGSLVIGCIAARSQGGPKSICGPDAKLFEQREPEKDHSEHVPGAITLVSAQVGPHVKHVSWWRRTWWCQIFGG
jgi:hypothetical protein